MSTMQQPIAGLNAAKNCCTSRAMERPPPYALDHQVLPTRDLTTARGRLQKLGFTVAPEGRHPFGTENACVYFSDGTFLEPLAIYSEDRQEEAIRAGNVFVSRDWAYRHRRGDEGFSAVVFGSDDATADDARMRANGVSAGDMLAFSRDFIAADGTKDTASFRLAFAADPLAPDFFLFTCQRVKVPVVDRSALQRHRNGVTRIKAVVLSASAPDDFKNLLGLCARAVPDTGSGKGSIRLLLANSSIELLSDGRFADRFGPIATDGSGLQARAIVFGVRDVEPVQATLRTGSIGFSADPSRVIVDPAPGQGAIFVFEVDHEQT
jgi:hypothetical protein